MYTPIGSMEARVSLPPTAIVIFGGTGDLAQTKLFSALLDLFAHGALPDRYTIIGISRKALTDAEYQSFVRECLAVKRHAYAPEIITQFCEQFRYLSGNFDDRTTYEAIATALNTFDATVGQCTNKLFYLAVPPQLYSSIFTLIDESDLMHLCDGVGSWARILVEKPFGRDLETAEQLEKELCARFTEEQIYRIDHYLAKDAVENIIALRFANTVLSDSWHTAQVESIQIKLAETKDVATRGSFYDGVGALRDVGQNHVLQILALLTMAPEDITTVTSIRQARAEILEHLSVPSRVCRGQYAGYTTTPGVAPDSTTETYFKITTELALPRWAGVPITLEAGKALDKNLNEVVVTFRPQVKWQHVAEPHVRDYRNVLTMQFSPEQRITLSVWVKKPGFAFSLEERVLELVHAPAEDTYSPEAYERVLFDCITGDQTRFVSGAEVMAAWKFITPLLAQADTTIVKYEPGSAGPETLPAV
jgi:glucose-6-phosphate 1-dehydrogenase